MRQGSVATRLRQTVLTLALPRPRRFPRTSQRMMITFGASWLLVVPLVLWAIATVYVPIMAPALSPIEAWSLALAIMLFVGLSLIGHVLAHTWAARIIGSTVPVRIPLYPFGDAAQIWPAADTPHHEALIAVAGPAMNLFCAGLGYLIWNLQLHTYLNTSLFFLAIANFGVAILNLAPGFPLDGGRLVRAIMWGVLRQPVWGMRLGLWLGRLMIGALAVWGIIVLQQPARFSLATGVSILFVAALHLLALWRQPAWCWKPPALPVPKHRAVRGLAASLLLLCLLSVAASMVPILHGLRAAGFAVAVEPMITVAPEHLHPYPGSFILTTVVEQTPIIAGQWVYAQVSPAAEIIQSERIVPHEITPQELMRHNYRLLEQSESVAVVLALRLAGYNIAVQSEVVEVISIVEGSSAQGILQPGDRILRLNSEPIQNPDQLFAQVREQGQETPIELEIERAGQRLRLAFPPTPPVEPGGPPWFGITVQTVRLKTALPFAIKLTPHKIVGGPSAGLMFTLAVYNLITPEDLTGGRRIAGTGTVNLQGVVGAIGGVKQKVAAAEAAGADYFLVPPANYADARQAARRIKVIEVATVEQAIDFLRSLPPMQE